VESSLDEIAAVLRQVVNDQHRLGVTLDGAAGGDFFVGTSAADLRLSGSLGPRDLAAGFTSASADNGNALVMADLGTRVVTGVGSADALVLDLASRLGNNAVSTEQMARVATSTLSTADDQRQSSTGVNLDEELADLVRYQRAYEASARVMQIADEMLERLINLTGR
jgi:flagellar hook-associated protein 1 FlgK